MNERRLSSMRMLAALFLISFCAAAIPAQAPAPDQTGGFVNGRFWLRMTHDMKLGWIHGYTEGLRYSAAIAKEPCVAKAQKVYEIYPQQLSLGEIAGAVDHFYRESPENAPESLTGAVQYVTLKAGGATQSQLNNFAATLRQISASESGKTR